eukprot:TRINITY_DN34831_c0_g1_i1.p3 TRINITY_DN34831_c0_g1~~TRINITY_DN34831_c0_g1_i1.p3  ORF type:complete len:125 (-),score=7.60 TRINITY_DN34831_c0_g1_i1:913-1287(-)
MSSKQREGTEARIEQTTQTCRKRGTQALYSAFIIDSLNATCHLDVNKHIGNSHALMTTVGTATAFSILNSRLPTTTSVVLRKVGIAVRQFPVASIEIKVADICPCFVDRVPLVGLARHQKELAK